jgi:hypothetical protein
MDYSNDHPPDAGNPQDQAGASPPRSNAEHAPGNPAGAAHNESGVRYNSPGLEGQLDAVLTATKAIIERLGSRIVVAFDGNHRDVASFGSLLAATNSFSALSRQYGSLAQLKLRIDRRSE